MAVEGNRKRSANVGHHHYGRLVTLDDGTSAFQPITLIGDPTTEGNYARVEKPTSAPDDALFVQAYQLEVLHVQNQTIIMLLTQIKDTLRVAFELEDIELD